MASTNTDNQNTQFYAEFKILGDKFFDMQEKCCFMNKLFSTGRQKCREAKMDLYMNFVTIINDRISQQDLADDPKKQSFSKNGFAWNK